MEKTSKIFLAGHEGLVGSALYRALTQAGYTHILTRSYAELDLTNQAATHTFFENERPDYVLLAAAKVGGIWANITYPAEFLYQNMMIASNVIEAAHLFGVKKLLNLGSSCIYPRLAPQPIREEALLSGPLEQTNEGYALAKIAAIKLCQYYNQQYGTNYISVMPTNQYGIGDNFNMETGHLLPVVLRRFHLGKLLMEQDWNAIRNDLRQAPLGWGLDATLDLHDTKKVTSALSQVGVLPNQVVMWGDGSVYRELMNSDDLADACLYLMENKEASDIGAFVNITSGDDIQLKVLFEMMQKLVGYQGKITYDTSKPNGTPRKMMDATHLKALGWQPKIPLEQGIRSFYAWYLKRKPNLVNDSVV